MKFEGLRVGEPLRVGDAVMHNLTLPPPDLADLVGDMDLAVVGRVTEVRMSLVEDTRYEVQWGSNPEDLDMRIGGYYLGELALVDLPASLTAGDVEDWLAS